MDRPAGAFVRSGHGHWGRVPALADAGLVHGFSCRDMTRAGEADAEAARTARRLATCLGLADLPRARLRQRHTARVHLAPTGGWGRRQAPVGDALLAADSGVVLQLQTADCLPVLILDPIRGVSAAAHAGWRGTLGGIVPATLEALRHELGAEPATAWVAVGPGIRTCCFEVGPEVEAAFLERWSGAAEWMRPGAAGRPHLDLVRAVRSQAMAAGVAAQRFLDTGWCTRCRGDRFFSYRGDGPGTGRIVTLAGLAGPAA